MPWNVSTEARMLPGLSFEGLDLVYPGGTQALSGINLQVPAGQFVSLVGPSGCGKSTLLRLAAGLLTPTAGKVFVEGTEALASRQQRGDTAFVFQQPTLLPWRSVEKNVQLPLELRKKLTPERRERVSEVIDMVGLGKFRRFFPGQLSGGMQMRVSLARALVTRPGLLLLDEPFAALDDITRQRLNEELLALWIRDRFTAVFVTHNVAEAVYLSQRIVILSAHPGRINQEIEIPFDYPRTAELRAEPEFARLAGHVSNLLRSTWS